MNEEEEEEEKEEVEVEVKEEEKKRCMLYSKEALFPRVVSERLFVHFLCLSTSAMIQYRNWDREREKKNNDSIREGPAFSLSTFGG